MLAFCLEYYRGVLAIIGMGCMVVSTGIVLLCRALGVSYGTRTDKFFENVITLLMMICCFCYIVIVTSGIVGFFKGIYLK